MKTIVIDKVLNEEELKEVNKYDQVSFKNLVIDDIGNMVEYLKEDIVILNYQKEIEELLKKRKTYQGFKKSILNEVKRQIILNVKEDDLVIDATVGNGNDTLFLAQIVKKGQVIGFDIQEKAIKNTQELVNDYKNVKLYLLSHALMEQVVKENVKLVLFNLGYLPKGDKRITTKAKSTQEALEVSLKILRDDGLILVVVYPGHEEGKKEELMLLNWLQDKKINYEIKRNTQNEVAPFLVIIRK